MKKRLILVNLEYKVGDQMYTTSRLASVKFDPRNLISDDQFCRHACNKEREHFASTFPHLEIIGIDAHAALETIYSEVSEREIAKVDVSDSEATKRTVPFGWFTNDTKPSIDPESNEEDGLLSDEVLIDVNGKRETFVTGCWHFDHGNMEGWWRVDKHYEGSIELDNMRWSYLPLAKYEK